MVRSHPGPNVSVWVKRFKFMNKELQEKILQIIEKQNKEKGPYWTGLREFIFEQLKSVYTIQDLMINLELLDEENLIEMPYAVEGAQKTRYGNIRLTAKYYKEKDKDEQFSENKNKPYINQIEKIIPWIKMLWEIFLSWIKLKIN